VCAQSLAAFGLDGAAAEQPEPAAAATVANGALGAAASAAPLPDSAQRLVDLFPDLDFMLSRSLQIPSA
jgi:hypothetical protein